MLLIVVLVLLAGCNGVSSGRAGDTPTPDLQQSPTPAEATSERPPSSSPATTAAGAETPSPTATATAETATDNPWGKATVTVGLSVAEAVQNESRHRVALRDAVRWHTRQNASAYPVELVVASPDTDPDVTVSVQPFIPRCDNETSSYTFLYCGPRFDRGDTASATETVQVSSVYEQNDTERIYRAALLRLTGSDSDRVDYGDEMRFYDPFPRHSPVPVNIENAPERVDATEQVQAAIDYWETGEGAPYRDYSVEFVVRPDDSDAPLTVRYTDSIPECGVDDSHLTVGCAPVLQPNATVGDSATIRINDTYTVKSMQQTLFHEFGHVYGRTHGEEPMPLMNDTHDRTREPIPTVADG